MPLSDLIRAAVLQGRWRATPHARQRAQQRNIALWQVEAGVAGWTVLQERPNDLPNPSIVVSQGLADGTIVTVVWAWDAARNRTLLVTVY